MDSLLLAQDSGASGGFTFVLIIAILGGFFYFLIIRPQRRQMRRRRELAGAIAVGDEVRTGGGILGTVTSTDEDTVVISTEDGSLLRVVRLAIVHRQEPPE